MGWNHSVAMKDNTALSSIRKWPREWILKVFIMIKKIIPGNLLSALASVGKESEKERMQA